MPEGDYRYSQSAQAKGDDRSNSGTILNRSQATVLAPILCCPKNEQMVTSPPAQDLRALAEISSTDLSTGSGVKKCSRLLCKNEQIPRSDLAVAEGADVHVVPALSQIKRAVEDEPHFQRPAEEVAQQFEVAHFGQTRPARGFKGRPVLTAGGGQLLEFGEVAAIVSEGFIEPGAGQ